VRSTKLLVLAAGITGIVAFFQPLVTVESPRYAGTVTSLDVLRGIDLAERLREQVDRDQVDSAEARLLLDNFEEAVGAVRIFLVVLYLPAVMLALVGLIGVVRGRLGRVGGGLAMAFGMAGAGVAGALLAAFATRQVQAVGGSAGIAVKLMLGVGVAGFLGGLLTLVSPDRGQVAR